MIFIHDSIGKHINPGILSKYNLRTTKVLAYKQDEAMERIEEIKGTPPKAVVINVGTNDVRDKVDADTIVDKYIRMTDRLTKKFPQTKIIFSNILPREDNQVLQQNVEYINAVTNRKLASKHVLIKNKDLVGRNLKAKDGIHLSTPGVSRLACSIRDSVVAALDLK